MHLLAVLLVSIFAGMLAPGAYARPQHAQTGGKNPLARSAAAAAAGKKTFDSSCEECHGEGGRGARGPALATGHFQHGGKDWQLFETISEGIPGTQMPSFSWLTSKEIWQVITYVRSLSGTVAAEHVSGDPVAGAMIFRGTGGCLMCHQVNGRGGIVGPDLSTIGQWNSTSLREFILHPKPENGIPDVVDVKTKAGRWIRGVRRYEDTFSLDLMDVTGKFHLLQKKDLAEIHYESKSLMPDDYGRRLSPDELQNLIAYLSTLRVRNLAQAAAVPLSGGVDYQRIRDSEKEPQNWLTHWGDYEGTHYTSLSQITPANVRLLQAKWAYQTYSGLEATPLVVDGIMYTTATNGASCYVVALDARSGGLLWRYQYRVKGNKHFTTGNFNRGVAILGQRLFFATVDAYLVALDARTGRLLWESQMADVAAGYGATLAPLAVKDEIITGVSGAEFGVRGFIDAYDPATGKRLWRFYTVPGPGEPGHDTWSGDSWKHGGGSTWMTGTYDPSLNLLYWGVGNPSPDMNGDVRKGDNLFTCSVVALNATTGKLKWYFQFSPHDTHDWDATETPVLVDRMFHGQKRKLLLQADRNGFFYVLDRTNGKFLLGKPFARVTWAKGLDAKGRPIPAPHAESGEQGSSFIYPGMIGANNWQAPSYDPLTSCFYLTFLEKGSRFIKEFEKYEPNRGYWGGSEVPEASGWGGIKALNPATGGVQWEYKFYSGNYYVFAGVLATGGGVVFAAASREGWLMAFDARTGKLLWRFSTGAKIDSSPMSYAVDGRQYVAISAGGVLYSFGLPE